MITVGVHKVYRNRMNLTNRNHTIRSNISETYHFNEHMETWQTAKEVHSKSDVLYNIQVKSLKSWFKIWHVIETLIQNLTRRKEIWFKIMPFSKAFFIQNHVFRKNFFLKIMLFNFLIFFKIVLFKYVQKSQNLRILRGKMSQNVFCVENFFQNLLFKNNFFAQNRAFQKYFISSKTSFLKLIFLQNRAFLRNIFLQNLTRRKTFNSKSDALWKN